MSPEPFDSRTKAPPAKRSEEGYRDENGQNPTDAPSRRLSHLDSKFSDDLCRSFRGSLAGTLWLWIPML